MIAAYSWAVNDEVNLINFSLGALTNCCFSTIKLIHELTKSKGIIPVYASGNFGKGKVACPAMLSDSISVGSMTTEGKISWFTSYGRGCTLCFKPDVYALGGGKDECVLSAWSPNSRIYKGYYACVMGTSQATPQVTSALALFMQSWRDINGTYPTYDDVVNTLYEAVSKSKLIKAYLLKPKAVNLLARVFILLSLYLLGAL